MAEVLFLMFFLKKTRTLMPLSSPVAVTQISISNLRHDTNKEFFEIQAIK